MLFFYFAALPIIISAQKPFEYFSLKNYLPQHEWYSGQHALPQLEQLNALDFKKYNHFSIHNFTQYHNLYQNKKALLKTKITAFNNEVSALLPHAIKNYKGVYAVTHRTTDPLLHVYENDDRYLLADKAVNTSTLLYLAGYGWARLGVQLRNHLSSGKSAQDFSYSVSWRPYAWFNIGNSIITGNYINNLRITFDDITLVLPLHYQTKDNKSFVRVSVFDTYSITSGLRFVSLGNAQKQFQSSEFSMESEGGGKGWDIKLMAKPTSSLQLVAFYQSDSLQTSINFRKNGARFGKLKKAHVKSNVFGSGVQYLIGNKHHLMADFGIAGAKGDYFGELEFWPFTSSLANFSTARQNYSADDASVTIIDYSLGYNYSGNRLHTFGSALGLLEILPQGRFTVREQISNLLNIPIMVPKNIYTVTVEKVSLLKLHGNYSFKYKTVELGTSLIQYIPLRIKAKDISTQDPTTKGGEDLLRALRKTNGGTFIRFGISYTL